MNDNLKKTLFCCAFAFLSAGVLAWFVSGITVGSVTHVPVGADLDFASAADLIRIAARCSFGCAVGMGMIFLSGFTPFPRAVSSLVLAFRGACLGATAKAVRDGELVFRGLTADTGAGPAVTVIALYAVSTLLFAALAVFAAFHSAAAVRQKGTRGEAVRYHASFLCLFGAAAALEFLRYSTVR